MGPPNKAGLESKVKLYPPFIPPTGEDEDRSAKPAGPVPPAAPLSPHELKNLEAALKGLGVILAAILDSKGQLKSDKAKDAKAKAAGYLSKQTEEFLARGGKPEDVATNLILSLPYLETQTDFPFLSPQDQRSILGQAGLGDITDRYIEKWNTPRKRYSHFFLLQAKAAEREGKDKFILARFYGQAADFDPKNAELQLEAAKAKMTWLETDKQLDSASQQVLLWETFHHAKNILVRDPDNLEALKILKKAIPALGESSDVRNWIQDDLPVLFQMKGEDVEVLRARKELLLHLDLKDEAQIFSRQLILGQLDAFKNLSAYKAKTLPAEQIRDTEKKMEAIADEIKELVDSSESSFEMGTVLRDVLRQFIHGDPAWAQENQVLLDPQRLFNYVSQTVETDYLVQKTQGSAATITDPKEKQAVLFKALGQYAALKNQDKIKETIGLLKESLPPFHAKSHLTDRLELNSAIALVIQGSSPDEEEKLLQFCAEDAEILSNQISMGRSDGTLLSPSEKLGALLSVRNYYLLIGAENESQALQADLKTARKEVWEQLKSGSKEDLDVKGRVKLAEYFYQANLILAESDFEEVRLKLASREARDHGSSTGPSEADLNSDTVLKEARAVVKRQLEASLVFWKTSMKELGMEHGEAKESDLRFRLDKGQSLLRMTADLSSLKLGGRPLFDSDELQKNIETAREILAPVIEAAMNKGLEEIALQGDSEQKGNIIQGVYLDVFSLLDNIDPVKPVTLAILAHASLEQIADFAKESHKCHEGLLQAQKLLDGKDAKTWIQEIKAGKANSQVLAQALRLFEESAQKFGALGLNDRVEESLQPLIQMAQSEDIPLEERGGILLQVSQTFQAAGMREKTNEILQQAIDLDTPGAPAPVQETAQLARAMQFLNNGKKQEAKDILNALPQNELAQAFLSGLAKSEKQKRDLQCLAVWEAVVADHLGDNPAKERVESFSQATQEIRELVLTGKATSIGDAIAKFMAGGRGVVGAKYSEVDNLIKGNTLGTDFTGVQLIQDLKDLGDPQMSDAEFGEKMVFLAKKLAYGSKFYSAGVSVTQIFIEDPQNTDPSVLAKAKELAEDIPGEAKFYQIATGIMQLALYVLPTGRIAGSVGKGIIGFGAGATVMLADKKYAHDFMKTLPMALGGLAIARLARVGVQSLFLRTTIAEGMSPLARGFAKWALGSAAEAAVLHPANMALEALVNWDTSHLTHMGFGDEFLANFVMFGLFHLNAIGTQRVTRALSKVEKFRVPGSGVAAGGLTPKLRPGIEKALKAFRYTTNLSTFMASDHFNEALGLRPTDEHRTFLAHLVECAKTDFLMHKAGKMADGAVHGATGGKVSLSKTEQRNQIKMMSLELAPGIKNLGLDPKSPAGQLALNILLNRAFAGGESPGEILKSFSEPSLEKYKEIVKTEFGIHDPSSKEGQEIFSLLLAYAHDRSHGTKPLAPEVLQEQLNASRQKVDSLMKENGVEGPKAEALKNVIMATALQKGLGADQIEDLAKKAFQAPEFAEGPSELEKSFEAGQRVYPVPPVKDGDPWTYFQTRGEKEPLAVDQKALQAYLNWSEKKALVEPQKAAEARAQALQPFFDAGVSVLPILNAKGDKPKFKWTAGEGVPIPQSTPSVADYQAFAKWNEAKTQELAKSKPPVRLAAKRGREAVAPAPPHKMSPASSRQVGDMGNLVGSDGIELPVPLSQGNPAVLTIEGKARIEISTQENGEPFLKVRSGEAKVEREGKSVAAKAMGIPLRSGDKIRIGDEVFVWELGRKQVPESKTLPPPTPNARMKAAREAVQGKADGSVQGLAADFGVSDAGGEGSKAFERRAKASPRMDVKAEAKKMGEVLSVLRESLLPHAENLNAYEMHFFKNDLFQQVMAGKMSLAEAKALAARVSKGEAHIEVQWFRAPDAPADGYKMVGGKAEPYNASADKGLGIKELQCREYYDHLVRENSEVAKDPKIRELVEAFTAELEKSAGYADSVKGLKAGTHVLTYAEGKIHLQKTADIKLRLDAAKEMAKKVFNEQGVTKIDTKTLEVFLRVVADDPTLTREVYETRFRGIVAALGSLAPRLRALPAEQRAPILESIVRKLAEGKLDPTVVEKVLGKGLSKERIAELEGQLGISQVEWLSPWFTPEPELVPAAKKSLVREAWDESGDIVREDIPPWVRQTFRVLVTAFDVPAILGIKIFDGTLERLNEFADIVNELFPIAKSEAKTPEPDKSKPGPARKQTQKPAALADEEATRELRAPVGEEDTRQVPVKKAARQAVEPDENTRQTRLQAGNQKKNEHSTIVNRPKRSGIREAKGVASEPLTHEEATILAVDHLYLQTFVRDEVIRLNGLEPPKSPVEILEARTAASGASAGKPKLPVEEIELTVATPEGAEKLREYLSKEASEGRFGTKLFPLTLKGKSSSGELILSGPGARDIFVRILSAGDVNQRLTAHRRKVADAIVAWEESGMRGLAGEVSEAQIKSAREFLAHGDNPPADADLSFMEANGYCYRAKIEGEGRGLLKLYTKDDAGAQPWTVEKVEGKKITLIKEVVTVVDGEEQSEVVRKVLNGEAIAPTAHPFAEGDAVVFLPQIAGGGPSAQNSMPFTLAAKKDSLDLDPYIHPGSTNDKADFQFMVSFAGVKNGEPQWMLTLGKRPNMPFLYAVEVDGKRIYQERIWVSSGQKIKTADGKVWQFEPPAVDAKHYVPSKWAKAPPPQGISGDPSAPSPWGNQNPTVKVAARRAAAQPAGPRPALNPSADSLPAKIPFTWDAKAQCWTAVLGRGGANQGANLFPIPSEVVSRQHAQIHIGPNGERILIDLSVSQGSMKSDSHGTWVLEGNQWRKLKAGEEYVLQANQPFALGTMASNGKAAPGEPVTVDKADFSGMEIFFCREDGFSLKSVHREDPRLRTVPSLPSEGGLKLVNGDYSFTLPGGDGETILGREDFGMGGNSGISAKHAKILTKRGKSFIQDLGSLNGTKVIRNGKMVFSGQDPARKPGYMFQLESGDKVFLGDAIINVF